MQISIPPHKSTFRVNLTCKSMYILCDVRKIMILIPDLLFLFNVYSHEEERFNPINSFLEGLFDSNEQVLVPNSPKPELFESFHFFDDVFLNESRMVSSVCDHEIKDNPKDDMQACKSLIACKVRKAIYSFF